MASESWYCFLMFVTLSQQNLVSTLALQLLEVPAWNLAVCSLDQNAGRVVKWVWCEKVSTGLCM